MKAVVIFNGIQFHYYLLDHAIDWAVNNKAELLGLFIHSNKEPPEGYIFPSDIDPAENLYGKSEAEQNNEKVIHDQVKLFMVMTKGKNIVAGTKELLNPSLEDIIDNTKDADMVFIDKEHDNAALLACSNIHIKKIMAKTSGPVEIVQDKN